MSDTEIAAAEQISHGDSTARVAIDTAPLPAPSSILGDLLALVAAEIAGAQTADESDALRVRAALLAWDGLGDKTRALELVADAEHPLVPALRLGLGASVDVDRAGAEADQAVLAAYTFARGGYAEAAELAERAGPIARLVRRIALGVSGSWEAIVRDAEQDDAGETIEEASAIALDRANDGAMAASLLRRLYEVRPHPYVIERLIELRDSGSRDGSEVATLEDLWRAKLQRLEASAVPERSAIRFSLAQALERAGNEAEADELVKALLADEDGAHGMSLLAHRASARLASNRGDWARTAEAWEGLARDSGSPTFAGAYLRRAAELWDARAGAADRAEPIFQRLHDSDPGDTALAASLVRLLLKRSAGPEIIAVLSQVGASREEGTHGALLLAAALYEVAHGASAESRDRWQKWADAVTATIGTTTDSEVPEGAQAHAFEGVARTLRGGGHKELIEHYRAYAPALGVRRAAAYLAVGGALALEEGTLDVAAALFDEAAKREENDLLVHAGRAILFERTERYAEQAAALRALAGLVESTTAQAALHKKLAHVSIERLHDVATAHESYERLLELEPEDVSVIERFAQLCAEGAKWSRAIQLTEKAASLTDGDRAAELLRSAGELSERQLNDDDAALASYERARERSKNHEPTLSSLAALHKKHNRLEPYLTIVRALVGLDLPRERHIELLLDYARTAERADGDAATHDFGRAFGAYEDILRIDAAHSVALQGLERLCRAGRRWKELAEAFARGPETLRTLRVRAECLEQLEQWDELAKVRERELALLEVPSEIAAAARALAELYESRLQDPAAAVRAWVRVAEAAPAEPEALRALQRLYEVAGEHTALVTSLERELALGDSVEHVRRVELWSKVGEVRRGPLAAPADAARAFEEVLRLEPRRPEVLEQLVEIYKALDRGDDLARILDERAATANNPQQRANVVREKAELKEREGDIDGALAAYAQAFSLDPESRACFTAYEKLCYKAERWKQALELYESAIQLVEEKKSRAYRLADLFARRGQLQLQYLSAPGEATASYKRVLELDPENDVSQTALERIFSAQSDWAGLISVYEQRAELVKTDARRVEILRRAARVATAKLRDANVAARFYERLHAVDPTDSEATDILERHYERNKQLDKLVALLHTRLSFTAGGEEAIALHLRMAQICEEGLRDTDKTIEAYQKILEIAPSNREAIEALGRLYEGTEHWAELVEVTRRQIRLVTDRAQKALLYFKCGSVMESKFAKEDDAIRYYDAAIKTSPSCLPAVHGLRDLYLRRQDWARVIQTLELEAKLWTEDKERAGVFANIAQIYGERLGDAARAIQYFETALQVDSECLPANKALFDLYAERGDYQQALSLAVVLTQKVAREGDPVERSEFYRKRAFVAERTGDLRAAADSLVVALEIRPENVEALDMLVNLCRSSPGAYDYATTFRELEKLHRKRDAHEALARVLVAQASLRELAYDIEGADAGYREALKLAPTDFAIVEPLVSLAERLRRFDEGEALIEAFLDRTTDPRARTNARLRLAELCGDAMMDSERAAAALHALLDEEPTHKGALYSFAQELFLLGRYPEARRAADRLITLATSPEHTAPPEELARYYDYLARIIEATGDTQGAGRAYRRAIDLDPTYPPSCLALARRAAAGGDLAQGTRILGDALTEAERTGNTAAALTLQRSRARFLVTWGELGLAVQAYEALLSRADDSIEDRLAYADLCGRSENTLAQAFSEIERVLSIEPRHSQAYRQLAQLYVRAGQPARAVRVYALMAAMGISEPSDRAPAVPPLPRRGVLSDELRAQYVSPEARSALTDVLSAVRESLEEAYPFVVPANAVPLAQVADHALKSSVQDLERIFGVAADVFIVPTLPGAFLANDIPKPTLYLSQGVAELPDHQRRVIIGAALEALRGGYALMTRIDAGARDSVINLLNQLVLPESERSAEAQSYVKALPRKSTKALEKLWTNRTRGAASAVGPGNGQLDAPERQQWFAALESAMRRASLIACDDLDACTRVHVRSTLVGGEATPPMDEALRLSPPSPTSSGTNRIVDDLDLVGDAVLALDRGQQISELVAFYLSEPYHQLRAAIGDAG